MELLLCHSLVRLSRYSAKKIKMKKTSFIYCIEILRVILCIPFAFFAVFFSYRRVTQRNRRGYAKIILAYTISILFILLTSCNSSETKTEVTSKKVQLITLDPGHFHAALVQKTMYDDVDSVVHVYAPAGNDLQLHLS